LGDGFFFFFFFFGGLLLLYFHKSITVELELERLP